jgi:UDP-3-O-[3-hydroxymyristoyl] glucosamine N-acyltransferase
MKLTVQELANMIGGKVEGDGSREIEKFAPIEEAEEGALSFLSNAKYNHYLYETKATCVLVEPDFVAEKPFTATLIRVPNVYMTLSSLLEKFTQQDTGKRGIEQPSYIAESAKKGNDIYVGAFAYIGDNAVIGDKANIYPQAYIGEDVKIGKNTIIYSGVKIYAGCEVGDNCIIHSGVVIGSDGFGFAPQPDGTYKKIPQTGKVIIKDNVEIGANTTIDRATIKATIIEEGVKLDNLIQIAHNVEVGAHTVIAAQAGISGSTKIGARSAIGGQVGLVGHITVAEGSQIGAQSGVSKAITEPNEKWFGSPAVPYKIAFKLQALFKKLPEIYEKIQTLEKELKELNVSNKRDEQ